MVGFSARHFIWPRWFVRQESGWYHRHEKKLESRGDMNICCNKTLIYGGQWAYLGEGGVKHMRWGIRLKFPRLTFLTSKLPRALALLCASKSSEGKKGRGKQVEIDSNTHGYANGTICRIYTC